MPIQFSNQISKQYNQLIPRRVTVTFVHDGSNFVPAGVDCSYQIGTRQESLSIGSQQLTADTVTYAGLRAYIATKLRQDAEAKLNAE